jgi:hypothetical protein
VAIPMIDAADDSLIKEISETEKVVSKKRQFIEEVIKRMVKAVSHKNTLKV